MEFFQLSLFTIASASYWALLAMGFGMTLRSVKFFNIAFGGAFITGGYLVTFLYKTLLIGFIPSVVLALLGAVLYMVLIYFFIFRRLLKRNASNFVLLITSFGILTATMALCGMLFGNQVILGARHIIDIHSYAVFSARLTSIQILNICITPVIITILFSVCKYTSFGRALRAVEDDGDMAQLVGISRYKILAYVFCISGLLAGMGGILEVFDVGLIPATGLVVLLPVIVASVIGGMKNFFGGIIGALIVALFGNITIYFFGGEWQSLVPFVLLIVVLLIRPQGLLAK